MTAEPPSPAARPDGQEVLANLPASAAELETALRRGAGEEGPLTYDLADALGGMHRCDRCGRPILSVGVLVEVLGGHYGLDDTGRYQLDDALRASGLETGSKSAPNFCSYHAQITSE